MALRQKIPGLAYQQHYIVTEAGLKLATIDLADREVIGVDIETTGLDPHSGHIRSIQLAYEEQGARRTCYVIDLAAVPTALEKLRFLFESGQYTCVGHNLAFEAKWLLKHGIRMRMPLFDTMIADRLLNNGDPRTPGYQGLADLVEQHLTDVQLDKTLQVSGWGDAGELSPAQIHYAALDAVAVLPLRAKLKAELQKETGEVSRKTRPILQEHHEDFRLRARWPHKAPRDMTLVTAIEMACVPAVALMEYEGLICDMEIWADLTDKLERATEQAYARMVISFDELSTAVTGGPIHRDLLGTLPVSFASAEQLIALLESLGVPVPEVTDPKTGRERKTVDQNVLRDGLVADYPALAAYLEWKELATALTKAHKQPEYINPATGRVHASYMQLGPDSGRLSARSPNVQQVAKSLATTVDGEAVSIDFRTAYRARPGWVMVDADLDQIELRLAAALAPDENLRGVFMQAEVDPHSNTARLMNNLGPDDPLPPGARTLGKIINFSSLYLISARKLRAYAKALFGVSMTEEEAEASLEAYRAAYPGIARWHQMCKAEAAEARHAASAEDHRSNSSEEHPARTTVFTVAGRRRHLVGAACKAPNLANTRIQGSGADLLKLAMGRLPGMLEAAGATRTRLVASIHDELLLHAPQEEAETAARVLEEALIKAGNYLLKGVVPVTTQAQIGDSWASAK